MRKTAASAALDRYVSECEREMRCVHARSRAEAKAIARHVARKQLEEVSTGLFARPEYWKRLKFRQRYLHQVRALASKHPDWTFCSFTAAVVHGLAVSHMNLSRIHIATPLTCTDTPASNIKRHRYSHYTQTKALGITVTPVDQTVVDCLLETSFVEGLIIADSALRENLLPVLSDSTLADTVERLGRKRRGIVNARLVAANANGLSESGGESKARALMIERGWMVPQLQVELPDLLEPEQTYRVDYLWIVDKQIIIGEFDGRVKSEQAAGEGRLVDFLFDERQRESRLSLYDNCKIVRLCWEDLENPLLLDRKLELAGVPRAE